MSRPISSGRLPISSSRLGLLAAMFAAAVTLAGCGGGASPNASPSDPGGDAMKAFRECLKKHGVETPERPEGQRGTPPSGQPPRERPSGGPGGMRSMSPERQKAMQACATLRPSDTSARPRGQGGGGATMAAFRDCMNKNGATIAETARPGALKTSDPKIAKALETCRDLLPSRAPAPSPS